MVYFGPWETYFLIAEALERQWITSGDVKGITAEEAYNKAIELSFIHLAFLNITKIILNLKLIIVLELLLHTLIQLQLLLKLCSILMAIRIKMRLYNINILMALVHYMAVN